MYKIALYQYSNKFLWFSPTLTIICLDSNESNVDICDEHNTTQCYQFKHASLLYIIYEALKKYLIPHHFHIDSHLTYFFLNYLYIGLLVLAWSIGHCQWVLANVAGTSSILFRDIYFYFPQETNCNSINQIISNPRMDWMLIGAYRNPGHAHLTHELISDWCIQDPRPRPSHA